MHWITRQQEAPEPFEKHTPVLGRNPALTPCSRHGPLVSRRIHGQAALSLWAHHMGQRS